MTKMIDSKGFFDADLRDFPFVNSKPSIIYENINMRKMIFYVLNEFFDWIFWL